MLIFAFSIQVYAEENNQANFIDQPQVQQFIKQTAAKYNFDPEYLTKIIAQAKFLPDIIPKMQHPAEAKPWGGYRDFFMTQERIQEGVNFYHKYEDVLLEAQERYGVPANIIAAILAVETRYGKIMGKYRVIDTLTTLSFSYPPRAAFFQDELASFFVLTREYHIDPLTVYGSRSGAVGLCQFMPSSYLKYAVTYSGGKDAPDLFTNPNDAIFSIANYFVQHGWQKGQPVTSPAHPTGKKFKKLIKANSRKIRKPSITLDTFAQFGVQPAGSYNSSDVAYLMQLRDQYGIEYWFGFQNFYVITRYNNSDLYAMAVYQMAKHILAKHESQKLH
jgi:membrane-bound lytic murein transglycosylase B